MFRSPVNTNKPVKIVLIGDGAVGKTSYKARFLKYNDQDYKFQRRYTATTDKEFPVDIKELKTNNGTITIELWDTFGQERYKGALRNSYLKGADAVIVFYDITKKRTIENLPNWLKDIKEICGTSIPISLIGNKIDMKHKVPNLDTVKMRKAKLRQMYNGNIENFLISVKNDSLLTENRSLWMTEDVEELGKGIYRPFEYVLTQFYGRDMTIEETELDKGFVLDSDDDF